MKNMIPKAIQKVTKQLTLNLTLAAVGLTLAGGAEAQTMLVKVLQKSDEIVSQVYKEVPIKSCRVEQIPIYGTQAGGQQASTADVVASAIFGGLLGSAIGDGKGKDAATLLGAIAGADMANRFGSEGSLIGVFDSAGAA